MTRLHTELLRLYLPAHAPAFPIGSDLAGALAVQGQTRVLVLELARPADWDSLRRVWQGVQADLALPAPAIAVNGVDGYQLWFSLAEPVALSQAAGFLSGLCAAYLGDVAPRRLSTLPAKGPEASALAALRVPAQVGDDRWSAFVTPDLARIFADDPWLDLPPADASQADVLAGLACARPDVFEAACLRLMPPATAHPVLARRAAAPAVPPLQAVAADTADLGPEAFLRQVMNDPGVSLALRIEAAKALLPLGRTGC